MEGLDFKEFGLFREMQLITVVVFVGSLAMALGGSDQRDERSLTIQDLLQAKEILDQAGYSNGYGGQGQPGRPGLPGRVRRAHIMGNSGQGAPGLPGKPGRARRAHIMRNSGQGAPGLPGLPGNK